MLTPKETVLCMGWLPSATSGSRPLKSLLRIWNGLDIEQLKLKFCKKLGNFRSGNT